MVKRDVGSNQYKTRTGIETTIEQPQDLMAQAGGRPSSRVRCGDVWGTGCRTWVQSPEYRHGNHPANPNLLAKIEDPNRLVNTVGIQRLSEEQLTAILRNGRLSHNTWISMISDPHAQEACRWNGPFSNWTQEQLLQAIQSWPPNLELNKYSNIVSMILQRLDGHKLLELSQDPLWSKPAINSLLTRRLEDRDLVHAACRYALQHDSTFYLDTFVDYNHPYLDDDMVQEVIASGKLNPYIVRGLIDQRHSHMSDNLLRQAIALYRNDQWVAAAVIDAIQDRDMGKDPHLHYLSELADRAKGALSAKRIAVEGPNISADIIEAAYNDPAIRAKMSIKARIALVRLPQCPLSIIEREAKSPSQQLSAAAAQHPQCPATLVLRALSITQPGTTNYKALLNHPNLPEEYRELARL